MEISKDTREQLQEIQQALTTIKRLMPEVEAKLSFLVGGVGAARKEKRQIERKLEISANFYKNHKVKNNNFK